VVTALESRVRRAALLLTTAAALTVAAPAGAEDGTLGTAGAGPASGRDFTRDFEARSDPAALDRLLAALTAAVGKSPRDADDRLLLARAESFWAELHSDAPAGEAIAHLAAGVKAAREALPVVSPAYADAAAKGRSLPETLAALEPAAAAALYWVAADQHQLAAERGLAALLLEADDLRRLFARVIELAPGTFHGGAYLHEAELALALPAGYSESLETAAADLAQAERLGPGWLRIDLVWAERWAVKAQDYGLFRKKLQRVLDGAPGADPDLGPENEIAKRKAKALLSSAQMLFTRAAIQRGEATAGGKR